MLSLSFIYPFAIRYLSFCDPILYLSFLSFQLLGLILFDPIPWLTRDGWTGREGVDGQVLLRFSGAITPLRINALSVRPSVHTSTCPSDMSTSNRFLDLNTCSLKIDKEWKSFFMIVTRCAKTHPIGRVGQPEEVCNFISTEDATIDTACSTTTWFTNALKPCL